MNKEKVLSVILLSVILASVLSGCLAVNTGSGSINQGVGNGNVKSTSQAEPEEDEADGPWTGFAAGILVAVVGVFALAMLFGEEDAYPG